MPRAIPLTKEFLVKAIRERRPEEIAKEFGCHPQIVKNYLKKFDIYWSRNNVVHDFFDAWSSDMAYILGFVTADGNVHKKRAYLFVEVSRKDEYILEYILSKVHTEGKIYHYEHNDKRTGKTYYSSKIGIFSKQIKESLTKYSIFPNKTGKHRINFHIPEEFVGDYLRGFFDGDGSIFKAKDENTKTTFACQSINFLEDIRKLTQLTGSLDIKGKPPKLTFGLNESFALKEILYKNEGFSLSRKKDRFDDMSIKYRVWTPELHSKFLDMIYLKYTTSEIASELNLTTRQILDHKRDYKRNAL